MHEARIHRSRGGAVGHGRHRAGRLLAFGVVLLALLAGCGGDVTGGPGPAPPPGVPPPAAPDLAATAAAFEAILASQLRDLPVAKALRDGMGVQIARAMMPEWVDIQPARPVGRTGEVCRWDAANDYWGCTPRPDPNEDADPLFELYETDPSTGQPYIPLRPLGYLFEARRSTTGTFRGPVDFQARPDGDGDHYPIYLVGWIDAVPGFELETYAGGSAGLFTRLSLPDVPRDSTSWTMESSGTLDWEPVVPDMIEVTGSEDSGSDGGERHFRVEWSEVGVSSLPVEFHVIFTHETIITTGVVEIDDDPVATMSGEADTPELALTSSSPLAPQDLALLRELYLDAVELAYSTLATARQSYCSLRRTESACRNLDP